MTTEWTRAERTVLEKITLAALAVHYICGLEKGSYTIAETRGYWTSAKSDPGAYADIASAETWKHTTENIWELVRDAEQHFEVLERVLSGDSAIENKAISAVNNEYQTLEETGHIAEVAVAIRRAMDNAASYAAEIGEEYRHEIECTPEKLKAAITAHYGFKLVHGKGSRDPQVATDADNYDLGPRRTK